jgi:hypothetical protein
VSNNCQLGLRVLKFQYEPGERIFVALILRNVGDKDIDYGFTGALVDYDVTAKPERFSWASELSWFHGVKLADWQLHGS